jgi:hypothetical protein
MRPSLVIAKNAVRSFWTFTAMMVGVAAGGLLSLGLMKGDLGDLETGGLETVLFVGGLILLGLILGRGAVTEYRWSNYLDGVGPMPRNYE